MSKVNCFYRLHVQRGPISLKEFSLLLPDGVVGVRNEKVMSVLDSINRRYGRGTLRLAAEGVEQGWRMRRGNLSPRYTTEWTELPSVRA